MKKIILAGCLLLSSNLFACKDCMESLVSLHSTLETSLDFSSAKKQYNISDEQETAVKEGVRAGLKQAMKVLNHNHPETNLTLDRYREIFE